MLISTSFVLRLSPPGRVTRLATLLAHPLGRLLRSASEATQARMHRNPRSAHSRCGYRQSRSKAR